MTHQPPYMRILYDCKPDGGEKPTNPKESNKNYVIGKYMDIVIDPPPKKKTCSCKCSLHQLLGNTSANVKVSDHSPAAIHRLVSPVFELES